MENIEVSGFRRSMARNEAIGKQGDRGVGLVLDHLLDRKHIMFVNRDCPMEY